MNPPLGLALVFVAALFQGSFILPMTLTRGWKWEHTWGLFSLLGMLIFNWAIGLALLPHLWRAIVRTPSRDLAALLLFGTCWGVGAILFGKGMERLGMAVGYPVIMGLILALGALIPLAQRGKEEFRKPSGLLLLVGTGVVIAGIVLCSRASSRKEAQTGERLPGSVRNGLIIAIFAGVLSCLPNIGLNNAAHLTGWALRFGASATVAPNAAWVVQFTAGFLVNFIYCAVLAIRRHNVHVFTLNSLRNGSLIAAMAALWIGSFYLYGIGASRMGPLGAVLGWPLFISLSIVFGNVCGVWRGEWKRAPADASRQLNVGLAVVLAAVALFSVGSALH